MGIFVVKLGGNSRPECSTRQLPHQNLSHREEFTKNLIDTKTRVPYSEASAAYQSIGYVHFGEEKAYGEGTQQTSR
jgi:hypothetical protein